MTKKQPPVRRPSKTWKPPRNRRRLIEAVGAAVGVVAATALAIYVLSPADPPSTVPPPVSNPPSASIPEVPPSLPAQVPALPETPVPAQP